MNNNIIKALSCLIGSNCLVSTPEAFYIGERGWLSEAAIIKSLELKISTMQVDIEVLRSDRDEILGRLSTTENIAINAQSLGENNFNSINILQGLHSETQLLVDENLRKIKSLELRADIIESDIVGIKLDNQLAIEKIISIEESNRNNQLLAENNFTSILILLGLHADTLKLVDKNTSDITKINEDINRINDYLDEDATSIELLVTDMSRIQMSITSLLKDINILKSKPGNILLDSTVLDNITQGNIKYGEEHKVVDNDGIIHGTFIMYAQDSNVVYGFKTTGNISIIRASDTEFAITTDALGDKYYYSNGNPA